MGCGADDKKRMTQGGRSFEKSAYLLVESPIKNVCLSTILFHVTLESLIDNGLKSSIFFKGGVLLIAGSCQHKSMSI
jgi:hypothetical protein